MMRLRLHSMVVILITTLLLSALGMAQEGAATKPGSDQEGTPPPATTNEQAAPEVPAQPILSGPYPVMSKAAEDRGRQVFEMFNHSEGSQIWASLVEPLRKRVKSEANYTAYNKKLRERMGPETKLLEENIVPYYFAPDTVYSRLSNFQNVPVPVMTMVMINQRGQIDSLSVQPVPTVAEGKFAGYTSKNNLHLPFNNEWLVYQGGRNLFNNGYAVNDDTRFALDFVFLKDNRLFSGAGGVGSDVHDYYCFGQSIVSPADGRVVKAEGGYDDNPPGKPSGDPGEGNVVAIVFGSGETTETGTFNHLKQNSLKVKIGDQVKQGQELAECGNSGAGPIPHVHFQVQRGGGNPVPVQFVDYIADGQPVSSGEPKRGQMVKNNPAAASSPSSAAVTTPKNGK